jgi:hypothetical protein
VCTGRLLVTGVPDPVHERKEPGPRDLMESPGSASLGNRSDNKKRSRVFTTKDLAVAYATRDAA